MIRLQNYNNNLLIITNSAFVVLRFITKLHSNEKCAKKHFLCHDNVLIFVYYILFSIDF